MEIEKSTELNVLITEDAQKDLIERGYGCSPEEASLMLKNLGYTEDMWDDVYDRKGGSREWRAYVRIARGTETRLLGEVAMQIRTEDGLPPVRLI